MGEAVIVLVSVLAVAAVGLSTLVAPYGLLEWAYLFLPPIMVAIFILAGWRLRKAARDWKSIESEADLSAFMVVAAYQMRVALSLLVLLGLWVIALIGGFTTWMTPSRASYMPLVGLVFAALYFWVKPMHRAIWSIPVADANLRFRYEHVCHVWKTRALPDW